MTWHAHTNTHTHTREQNTGLRSHSPVCIVFWQISYHCDRGVHLQTTAHCKNSTAVWATTYCTGVCVCVCVCVCERDSNVPEATREWSPGENSPDVSAGSCRFLRWLSWSLTCTTIGEDLRETSPQFSIAYQHRGSLQYRYTNTETRRRAPHHHQLGLYSTRTPTPATLPPTRLISFARKTRIKAVKTPLA